MSIPSYDAGLTYSRELDGVTATTSQMHRQRGHFGVCETNSDEFYVDSNIPKTF